MSTSPPQLLDLLKAVRSVEPPKPAEVLRVESAKTAADKARTEARAAAATASKAALTLSRTGAVVPAAMVADLARLEAAAQQANNTFYLAKQQVVVVSARWRKEYAEELDTACQPIRHHLHHITSELREALTVLSEAATRAQREGVQSPWLGRATREILPHLSLVIKYLDTDEKL